MNYRLVTAAGGVRTLTSVFEFANGLLEQLKARAELPAEACECVTAAHQAIAALQEPRNSFRHEAVCPRHYLAMCDALHVQCTQILGECCASVAVAECMAARTLSVQWNNLAPLYQSFPAWTDIHCNDECDPSADADNDEEDGSDAIMEPEQDQVHALDLRSKDPPADARSVHAFAWAPADFFWVRMRIARCFPCECVGDLLSAQLICHLFRPRSAPYSP